MSTEGAFRSHRSKNAAHSLGTYFPEAEASTKRVEGVTHLHDMRLVVRNSYLAPDLIHTIINSCGR